MLKSNQKRQARDRPYDLSTGALSQGSVSKIKSASEGIRVRLQKALVGRT